MEKIMSDRRPAARDGIGRMLMSTTLAQLPFDSPDARRPQVLGAFHLASHRCSPGYVGHDRGGQLTEYVPANGVASSLLNELGRLLTSSRKSWTTSI